MNPRKLKETMSDGAQITIAAIQAAATIGVIIAGRWMSRRENLKTQDKLEVIANGMRAHSKADGVAQEKQQQTDKGNPPV